MSISVLNTDAGLSGKTIVSAEGAHTLTGLHTFDRDPNPPFAVSANSAVVTNLDADKVDGLNASDWADYFPSISGALTIGNGTLAGRSMRFGDLVHFLITVGFGSTSSWDGTNVFVVSLPVTAVSGRGSVTVLIQDSGGTAFVGAASVGTTTLSVFPLLAGTAGQVGVFTNTSPITWSSGDSLSIRGWFEAA